jgi:hypothetical protein
MPTILVVEAALQAAATEHPDLVLLAVMLPDLDGLEVTRQLRREAHVPIISTPPGGPSRSPRMPTRMPSCWRWPTREAGSPRPICPSRSGCRRLLRLLSPRLSLATPQAEPLLLLRCCPLGDELCPQEKAAYQAVHPDEERDNRREFMVECSEIGEYGDVPAEPIGDGMPDDGGD